MKTNKYKPEKKDKKIKKKDKKNRKLGKATQEILAGDVLEKKETVKWIPFILFLTLLAFLYITNDYIIESKVRKIGKLQKELMELRYEYVSVKSNLMNISKQSQLAKRLEKMGIKENKEPVKVIRIQSKEK